MAPSEAKTAIDRRSASESPLNPFYRTVWRWHFYAGLFVIPFMLILATTGIIYLFKPQLDAAMYHNLLFVQPSSATLPYSQQVQIAQSAYPAATVTKFTPNPAADRSAEVVLTTADARNLAVFVDPYAGKVLGDRDEDNNLQAIAEKMHGELLIGTWGDRLVELAACWALVLLISGLYLWLPRRRISGKLSLMGTLIPRLWSKNKRIFWRDLHAVPGFYGALLIGFLILSGLPWTGFWGDTFAQVWGRFPAEMWDNVPQSTLVTGSLNQSGNLFVPWAAEQMPMPQSTLQSTSQSAPSKADSDLTAYPAQLVVDQKVVDQKESPSGISDVFNAIIALAIKEGAPPGFSVAFPEGETGVYTVSAAPNDPKQEVTMHMDQYSGKLLASVGWKDYGLVPKAVEMGVAIHTGRYFGLANQLLMLFAASVTILLSVTGAIMWWQRRPKGVGLLGAPEMPPYVQNWKAPLAIVAVLGLIFPLVGLSLVVVLLLDYGLGYLARSRA
jgi:uncharacterized iron-regulated membrane protein